jgi:DNA-directed RNA polymerase subunit E'/Rpb7
MLLTERVKLEPSFLHKQFREEVVRRLKIKVEGVCSRHGYIRPDSIEVHKICTGKVELVGLNGNTEFDIVFYADVCNPMLGSVIKCRVSNINKFGILAEAENVIETIIAKNSVNIQSDIDLDKIRIGDEIMVEVVGKKYELNEKKISLIGRVVKDPNSSRKTHNFGEDGKANTKRIIMDDTGDDGVDEVDDVDDDADVRSLVGGAKSDADSDDEAENDDSDTEAEDEEVDADADADADELEEEIDGGGFGEEGSDYDGDDKHNGNFFSDEEDDFYGTDAEGGSLDGDGDDDDILLSDDE